MEAILLQQPFISYRALYDVRYFFFEKTVGRWVCGMAFQSLLGQYRKFKQSLHDGLEEWYQAIAISRNPSVLGYLVEHVSLAALERSGLANVDQKLGHRMEKEYFDGFPDFSKLFNSTDATRLYLPTKFNFSDIDAAIVRLDRKTRQGFVYPIQVTIARSHKDSEAHFYSAQWDLWNRIFTRNDFEVSSTFVWIDRQGPSEEEKGRRARKQKKAVVTWEKTGLHEHGTAHIGIKSLDEWLANELTAKGM